jgi:predicted small metal-binding protein
LNFFYSTFFFECAQVRGCSWVLSRANDMNEAQRKADDLREVLAQRARDFEAAHNRYRSRAA